MINILMESGFCESATILGIFYYFRIAVTIFYIVTPILLLLSLMIEFTSAIFKSDQDLLQKALSSATKRVVAALLIFFVPSFVSIITNIAGGENVTLLPCYTNATKEYVASRREAEKLEEKARLEAIRAEMKKAEEEARKAQIEAGGVGNISEDDDYVNGRDIDTSQIARADMSVGNIGCVYNATGFGPQQSAQVNVSIVTQYENIMRNICKYVTTEATWVGQIEHAGSYVAKAGYHGKGLAVDMNTHYTYTDPNTGKTYHPYACAQMMGIGCWNNYNSFICDICDGKEDCKYNVNYIIYNRYFKGNGWCWGGDYSPSAFDPIHMELPSRDCYHNRGTISCN